MMLLHFLILLSMIDFKGVGSANTTAVLLAKMFDARNRRKIAEAAKLRNESACVVVK